MSRLASNRRPDVIRRDQDRLVQDIDGLFDALPQQFAERWTPESVVTAVTVRPRLKWATAVLVDSRPGDVTLYLPGATTKDAGRTVYFIKKFVDNHCNVQTADGALIQGAYTRVKGFTQVGLHAFAWDGTAWWYLEHVSRVRLHEAIPQTLGLWQFANEDLLGDVSGNNFDLTVETGTERRTRLDRHTHGFYFDGSTSLIYNVSESRLRLTGDMTFLCLWVNHTAVNSAPLVCHLASGETEATNTLYRFGYGTYPALNFASESGGGVDASLTASGLISLPGQLCHAGFTRTSGVVQFYQDGKAFGDPSAVLTTPTGGTDGRLRIGSTGGIHANGAMASALLVGRALSAAEIREQYNFTMGLAHGFVGAA